MSTAITETPDKVFDLRIDASLIICVDALDRVLRNHSLIIKSGKIKHILPTSAASEYSAREHIELSNHVLIPGLINAHGHAAMALFRGLANDMPLHQWLQDHIWPAEGTWVGEQFVRDGTQLAIAEMVRGGTTCFSDMYFFPEIVAKEASNAGIRAQLCCPVLDFPTIWGSGPDEYIDKALTLNDKYANSETIRIAFGPHAPYTVSDAPIQAIVEHAKERNIPVQMHIHETQQEVDDAVSSSGLRPIERLNRLGLFQTPNLQCVHMTSLNNEDIGILKSNRASVIHCPESNMKLASGFAPIQQLLDENICVALGTDGPASNNDLDMLGEMRTAALIAKGSTGDASAVDAKTALRMATINGAKALGLDQETGSIEAEKAADLCAVSLDALNAWPNYDPIATLVYNTTASQVSHVWCRGEAMLIDKKLRCIKVDDTLARTKDWASKIQKEVHK